MASSNASPSLSQFSRIRPKKPLDIWSTREKLCLASAVFKIGDQNWVSVSRTIKPYAEPNRPPEWFHQKNCVLQYYDLLEQLEQQNPKRKRGDKAETDAPSLQIMRKMTIERSEQLKRELLEMQQEFKQLKEDSEAIEAGHWDDRLEDEWAQIQEELKVKEEDVMVEVTDLPQKDSNDSLLDQSSQGLSDVLDESQDLTSESIDVSGLEEAGSSSSQAASSISAVTSLDMTGKLPLSSHLLSSLLQSEVKTANELQRLKTEQEKGSIAAQQLQPGQSLISSLNQRSLLKTNSTLDLGQSSSTSSTSAASVDPSTAGVTVASDWSALQLAGENCELEDSHIDVMTEVVEETVQTDDISVIEPGILEDTVEEVVLTKMEDDSPQVFQPDATVKEEVMGVAETEFKMEGEIEEVVVEEDVKDSTTELDVETLDGTKDDAEKEDDEALDLKPAPESLPAITDTDLVEAALKAEPLSPSSSISSRISESGSKRGKSRGRPRSGRPRLTRRLTDDERKDDAGSSKFSDVELSDDDNRDCEDLPGILGASTAGSILSESFPNSPASLSICSDTEEEKSYKQWKKSIMLVWRSAAMHKYANVFLHPVTDEIAPGYRSVVLKPMDLGTIKKNVETGAIRTTVEFQRDLMLMFSNAIMYNSTDHNVNRMATEMYDDVMRHIEIMIQTSDAKSLRQSRRPDASDKEDDGKKRRLSVDQAEGGKTKKRKTRLDE